ncbi:MAG: four helix bundle protein [Pseudomonadota bacterium]
MAIERFEDIKAWQKAQDLAVDVYFIFGKIKDFGFRDQICRAVVSVSSNIAEGFSRSSNADFVRFLYIAIASCNEVRSLLYLAQRLDYLPPERKDYLTKNADEVAKIIKGLIKSMTKKS